LNGNTFRTLEFEAIRNLLLSHAGSAQGKERLQRLAPLTEIEGVRGALERTSQAVRLSNRLGRQPYHDLPDLSEILPAARVAGQHLEPSALMDVASFVDGAGEIAHRVAGFETAPHLAFRASQVRPLGDLSAAIRRAILPSGEVADDASPRLSELRRSLLRLKAQLTSVMEAFLRSRDSERLLQDKIVTTRNDRYVLLLKAEHRGQLPGVIHGSSGSGASLFVEPMPAVELNNDIVSLQDEERREVIRILGELTGRVGRVADDLAVAADVMGELDALQAMALAARDMDAVEPEMAEGKADPEPATPAVGVEGARPSAPLLDLKDARHPLLMSALAERLGLPRRSSREPVPVSLRVGSEAPVLVVSGPNTGGKTVALKTLGLLALMAQSGLHVPAAKGSRLPVFRRVYADIGDDQSIAENLSTFSAHLASIVEMTRDLALPALVLLDEVGAGTDPTEGGALGVAIVDHFRARGATVVASTHHGLMKAYAQSTPGVACASFGYHPDTYQPTFRLTLGVPGRSLALEMAERLGLPASVVADARSRRDEKEAQAEALLQKLERDQATLEREGARLAEEQAAFRTEQERLLGAEREIEARRRSMVSGFAKDLARRGEELARQAADAIQQAVKRVETAQKAKPAAVTAARADVLREIREAQAAVLRGLPEVEPEPVMAEVPVAVGMRARVRTMGVVGEVMSLGHGEAELAVSGKRLRVPVGELLAVGGGRGGSARPVQPSPPERVKTSGSVPAELNLVGLRVEEALPLVDKLLDDAALSDRREIRVIHGFGSGRLRQAVVGLLQGHPQVASFRSGSAGEGGGGATVVELKE
jgi:DNA mismatch repair protein MutS2